MSLICCALLIFFLLFSSCLRPRFSFFPSPFFHSISSHAHALFCRALQPEPRDPFSITLSSLRL